MKTSIGMTALALAAACVTPAAAQIGVEANGARADGRWGGELGVGYAITLFPGLKVTPAAGALIYAEDNGRYYVYDNGGSRACRDSQTGRYADKDLCDNTRLRAYGRIEATYTSPLAMTLGVGARISDDVVPYGTIAFPIAPKLQLTSYN